MLETIQLCAKKVFMLVINIWDDSDDRKQVINNKYNFSCENTCNHLTVFKRE